MSSFSFSFDSPTNPWVIPHALNDEHVFWVIYNDSGEGIGSSGCVLRGTPDKGRYVNALRGPAAGSIGMVIV